MTSSKRVNTKPPVKSSTKPDATKPVKTYVDLSKLRKTSLKRYKKHFNLDVKADSKTELLEAVGRHFAQMPVREADVALDFYNFLRNLRAKRTASSDPSSIEHSPPAAVSSPPTPPATTAPAPTPTAQAVTAAPSGNR